MCTIEVDETKFVFFFAVYDSYELWLVVMELLFFTMCFASFMLQ